MNRLLLLIAVVAAIFLACGDGTEYETSVPPVYVGSWCATDGYRAFEYVDMHGEHHIDISPDQFCTGEEQP